MIIKKCLLCYNNLINDRKYHLYCNKSIQCKDIEISYCKDFPDKMCFHMSYVHYNIIYNNQIYYVYQFFKRNKIEFDLDDGIESIFNKDYELNEFKTPEQAIKKLATVLTFS